ncbi:hypothetical protein NIES4101_42050 [Calothrix sp. NIES-4101]|nr:hypothetical protein NIES4101_42050 [Calothrix sp. NIES-4101]
MKALLHRNLASKSIIVACNHCFVRVLLQKNLKLHKTCRRAINKDSKISAGTQLLKPSNKDLYPSIDPPVVPKQGDIAIVKYIVNLRGDKFLSGKFKKLQPGEKLIVRKVEIFKKSSQASPYIVLRAQVSKCDRTCSHK